MTPAQLKELRDTLAEICAPPSTVAPSTWASENLVFDEPDNHGTFTLAGRAYIAEPVDNWADPTVTDQTLVFGSQTGKTTSIMAGAAWTIANNPARFLWVMPSLDLARGFSRTRWAPMLRASPTLATLIPGGRLRHTFKSCEQQIGGAIVNFAGAASPANLASIPARVVILDECDKYALDNREADPVQLAEQRTKNFTNPKRIRTSTPTLTDGLAWQSFLAGDQRRFHVPCPHCSRPVILAWSPTQTILAKTGAEAFVFWDGKRSDGTWDLETVRRSAHARCPYCAGHISDAHKVRILPKGTWQPTNPNASRGNRSYHLPSLYSSARQCGFGALAVKFLERSQSLLGLQGFINGELAEPWESQDTAGERVELITRPTDPPLAGTILLTADYQATTPHLFYVARCWTPTGDSRLVEQGHIDADDFDQLDAVAKRLGVQSHHVAIDSGHHAQDVYSSCLAHGAASRMTHAGRPIWLGWIPAKGQPRERTWKDKGGHPLPWTLGQAATTATRYHLPLLEFNSETLKDILHRLRHQKTPQRWEVPEAASDDAYWRHLDAEIRVATYHRRTNRVVTFWRKRSQTWPDHLRDAEILQLALALFLGFLQWTPNS